MKALKLLAAAALLIGIAGCDTNAFTEDYPDPGSGLPPYVAFDVGQLNAQDWAYDADRDDLGSFKEVDSPPVNPLNLIGIRPRLTTSLREDIEVSYSLSGNAEYGVDYVLQTMNFIGEDVDPDGEIIEVWEWENLPPGDGSFTILFADEDQEPTQVAPHFRDVRIQILANPDATGTRTLHFDLVGASAPSGREINVGRLPSNRDTRATVIID